MLDRLEERDVLMLMFALGVMAFTLARRRRLAQVPAWGVIWASFWVVLGGWTLTVLEGFLWPNVLSLLSHLCYAASSVLAAVWCWLAFVAKPNEDRDVVRGD
jgi:CHASE2 domain-containing sensor protein